jgi:hypothetical protein
MVGRGWAVQAKKYAASSVHLAMVNLAGGRLPSLSELRKLRK